MGESRFQAAQVQGVDWPSEVGGDSPSEQQGRRAQRSRQNL